MVSELVKPATETSEGLIVYTCSKCGYSVSETVPKLTAISSYSSFSSISLYMTQADVSACDAIAKSFFYGEISADKCESLLYEYRYKYVTEQNAISPGFGYKTDDAYYNSSAFSSSMFVYRAQITVTYSDGTTSTFKVIT